MGEEINKTNKSVIAKPLNTRYSKLYKNKVSFKQK
jgi:hypothetical protein